MTLTAVAKVYYITALVAVVLFSAHCDGGPKRLGLSYFQVWLANEIKK